MKQGAGTTESAAPPIGQAALLPADGAGRGEDEYVLARKRLRAAISVVRSPYGIPASILAEVVVFWQRDQHIVEPSTPRSEDEVYLSCTLVPAHHKVAREPPCDMAPRFIASFVVDVS